MGGDYCVLTGTLEGPMYKGNMDNLMGVLPKECTPDRRLIFSISTGRDQIRVDVLPDSRILWVNRPDSRSSIVSLDGISFSVGSRDAIVYKNGWRNYGHGYRNGGYTVQGDV